MKLKRISTVIDVEMVRITVEDLAEMIRAKAGATGDEFYVECLFEGRLIEAPLNGKVTFKWSTKSMDESEKEV
jgi:hypothetical protein